MLVFTFTFAKSLGVAVVDTFKVFTAAVFGNSGVIKGLIIWVVVAEVDFATIAAVALVVALVITAIGSWARTDL